jgi:hypothetical protein
MIRLLVKFGSTVRRIGNVNIANQDGSINLSLIRAGTNEYGWAWNSSRSDFDKVEYADPKPKTKRITIHTSGRVNYHVSPNPGVNFIPCLLDFTEAMPFVVYVIPTVTALDLAGNIRSGDHVVEPLFKTTYR